MFEIIRTELLGNFHFLRPEYLWLLIPLLVIVVLFVFSRQEEILWKKNISEHLRPFMIHKGNQLKEIIWKVVLYSTVIVSVFGLAGPAWEKIEIPGKTLETPVVLILDLSQSMMATDIQPTRLERAKFKILDLLKVNPGARVALVGFAGTSHIILPLTNDYSLIDAHINQLNPSVMPFYGSDLEAGLEKAIAISSITNAPATFIIFTDDFDENSFEIINRVSQESTAKFEIFPVNTRTGSTIPYGRYKTKMKNKQGKEVYSKLNFGVLEKLHSLERVRVNYLTLDNSDVVSVAKSIKKNLKFTDEVEKKEDDWQDQGLFFVIPFALSILFYFRKGMTVYIILFGILFGSCSQKDRFKDLWFTKDFQGQKEFDKKKYETAAVLFKDPLRKGVSFYKAGVYTEAIRFFSKDTTAEGMYNLGLSYYKNGDYVAAALAFGKTIELDPTMKIAQENKMIAQHMLEGTSEMPEDATLDKNNKEKAQNEQNKSPEDLSGGGQEATEKDMQKKRLEEITNTDIRKGKELDELPDDFELGKVGQGPKILMQKEDDDPSLFLKRKFRHQVKEYGVKPKHKMNKW
ncbi:VWA domain-containing protein [Flavicella sp.]|uniref:VWA domain-containing protein n=1 Tax=Flavicella sp. TaxID=2957742 RepID=UPI003019266F